MAKIGLSRGLQLILLSLASCLLASPYAGVFGGLDYEPQREGWIGRYDYSADASGHVGSNAGLMLGYEWDSGWRAEVELMRHAHRLAGGYHRYNIMGNNPDVPVSSYPLWVRARRYSVMGNVGAKLPSIGRLHPFVMGGLGTAHVTHKWLVSGFGSSPADWQEIGKDDTTKFAYQGIAGVEVPMGKSFRIGAQYRIFHLWGGRYDHSGELVLRFML